VTDIATKTAETCKVLRRFFVLATEITPQTIADENYCKDLSEHLSFSEIARSNYRIPGLESASRNQETAKASFSRCLGGHKIFNKLH